MSGIRRVCGEWMAAIKEDKDKIVIDKKQIGGTIVLVIIVVVIYSIGYAHGVLVCHP